MKRNRYSFDQEEWKALLIDNIKVTIPFWLFQSSQTLKEFRADVNECGDKLVPFPFSIDSWNLLNLWHSWREKNQDFLSTVGISDLNKLLLLAHHMSIQPLLEDLGLTYAKLIDNSSTIQEIESKLQISTQATEKEQQLFANSKASRK